jgi:hypothetical protein
MVTIHRARGLRVVVYLDDHEPAHVHVFGGGQAKINLVGSMGNPELVWVEGMTRGEVRRAMKLMTEQRDSFLAEWRRIHG